ncbi:MAG: hypothetical protein WB566_03470 [Terriglobales bacterium]
MKKLFLVILLVIMASAMALAQVTAGTPTSTGSPNAVAPTVDVLGAHNNYGRGCAGCHAPHSGNRGAGGNAITGATSDPWSGSNALFAQDMGPLLAGNTFDFSDISNTGSANKYILTTPNGTNPTGWTGQQYSDVRGIVMCLACHDGAVAKGAMMQNWAYEEQIGALPSSYGKGKIPTLLGADGSSANYNNDHPIGESATLSAAMGSTYGDGTNGLVFVINGTAPNQSIGSITANGNYKTFMASYGAPAIMKGAHSYPTPINAAGVPYLVCTTCHNQHVMNVYAASTTSPIANAATGTYATYFFINGPYNVNDVTPHPTSANTTTQFCRQCHFGEANEANGGTLPTSF